MGKQRVSILIVLIVLLIISSSVAFFEYNQTLSLQNQVKAQSKLINELYKFLTSAPVSESSPKPTTIYPKELPATETALSQYSDNITQGGQITLNVTIASFLTNETTTESIGVTLLGYNNAAWSGDPQRIFNATFATNPLVLGPEESETTNMTMNIAENAPVGRYVFAIGNVAFIVIVNPN
jgi:hypothetical protein